MFLETLQNITVMRETLKFPTEEDLTGAAVALMRLQDTYQLETSSLARGELNGVQYSTQLSGLFHLTSRPNLSHKVILWYFNLYQYCDTRLSCPLSLVAYL